MKQMISFVLIVLIVAGGAVAETPDTAKNPPSAPIDLADPSKPLLDGKALEQSIDPGPLDAEQQALQRLVQRYDARLHELEQLARGVKGMELAELNRRVEALKSQQFIEELQVRVDVAVEHGDERRRLQMERVVEEVNEPRRSTVAPRERRSVEESTGGGR